MSYLVHGATGAQGSPVLHALRAAGKQAAAITRSPIASTDGAVAVTADYSDPASLASAYRSADGVFVHLPLGPDEVTLAFARNVVTALAEARPGRVVISTSGSVVDQPGSPLLEPEGSPIRTLIEGVADAGLSSAVIAPRLFFENLLLSPVLEPAREDGILRYPLRDGYAVSWASHLDIADVAVALFENTDVTGTVGVGQSPGIAGDHLAAAFAEHLGREVRYEAITPEAFGQLIVPLFGEAAVAGVVAGYVAYATLPDFTIDPARSAQTLLGITPRTPGQWLADVAVSA